ENVRDGVEYPRILAVTSLNDTRVLYVEPAKWVARLRGGRRDGRAAQVRDGRGARRTRTCATAWSIRGFLR
ncbi:hypothetical protein CTI14_65135, partial [Methylobacterium radiotolerans]